MGTRREKLLTVLPALLAILALPPFLLRVRVNEGCDFPEFWAAGRHVLEHGARLGDSLLYRYLPSLDVAWALFGWMPLQAAAPCYFLFSSLTWAGLLATVKVHLLAEVPQDRRRGIVLLAAALTIVFALDHLMLGAFHILMVWLLVAGLARIQRGAAVSGACLVGGAIWLKLLPLLAVPYLLLKRRWTAACLSVLMAVALDVGLSVAAYGPTGAWTAHVDWWHGHAVGDLHSLLSEPGRIADQRDRNQSLAAVMRRTLTHMGSSPAETARRGILPPVADLTSTQLKAVYFGTAALAAALLAWFWRKPATAMDPPRAAAEIATVSLATLWFSPILFSYHPVAALPALAVLSARASRTRLRQLALTVWVLGTLLLAIPAARAAGEILWASAILGVALAAGSGMGFGGRSRALTGATDALQCSA